MFGEVQRSGNCWYATTYNLSLHHGICPDGVNSPDDLRTKITDSLEFHPSFAATEDASVNDFIWFRDVFGSQVSNVEAFKKQHRTEGMYTDNMGIIVFLTQHLLKVNMKIVSTSCNQAQPFTLHQYMGPGQAVATFNIGHYQDLTHRGGQGGHYHSLRKVDTPQVREASGHSDIAFFFNETITQDFTQRPKNPETVSQKIQPRSQPEVELKDGQRNGTVQVMSCQSHHCHFHPASIAAGARELMKL